MNMTMMMSKTMIEELSFSDDVLAPADLDEYELGERYLDAIAKVSSVLARDRKEALDHDRNGYYAEDAGSEACLALGHGPAADPAHSPGFDGDLLCTSTAFGACCTYCESDCCEARRLDVNVWSMPGVEGRAR